MQQVCHSERSAAKSKNLRTYSYIGGEIGAKILRLPSVAQDDTVISTVLLIKADNHKHDLSQKVADSEEFATFLTRHFPPPLL